MSDLVRSAALTDYAEVARSVGLDPLQMLRRVGIGLAALQEPDLMVPADAVRQLLEDSAAQSHTENFGLRMAERRRLSNLGPVGLLARDEPTLRLALQAMIRYGSLHNQALHVDIEEAGGIATIREELLTGSGAVRQSIELTLGALMRILRVLLGQDWAPRRVCLMHPQPTDASLHHRLLGRRLDFGQAFNGIVCTSADLDTPLAASDPVMARYARQTLEAALPRGSDRLAHELRQLMLVLLPTGRCSVEQVAQHLGMTRRTLHRQLAERGQSFSALLQALRLELTARYLEQPGRPLAEVAQQLGFSAQSAFSRWHRQHRGLSPRQSHTPKRKPPELPL